MTLAGGPGTGLGAASAALAHRRQRQRAGRAAPRRGRRVRLLDQATFGPTPGRHRARAATRHRGVDRRAGGAAASGFLGYLDGVQPARRWRQNQLQEAWFQAAAVGPDQLRQRVANALLEILVVGSTSGLEGTRYALAAYMDVLMRNAFGNFRTLLEQVTLSPAMGRYLDMLRNQKEDPRPRAHPQRELRAGTAAALLDRPLSA